MKAVERNMKHAVVAVVMVMVTMAAGALAVIRSAVAWRGVCW